MLVRIEAIVSAAGGENAYLATRLGEFLLGRAFKHQVVTFVVELTPLKLEILKQMMSNLSQDELNREFKFGVNPVQLESIRIVSIESNDV